MCCEGLVCGACAGRVSDARCPTCRAYRDAHHSGGPDWAGLAAPLLVVLAALLLLIALHTQLA